MKLYVVRNKEGKFFRSIGYGGTGANWVEGLDTAKFYTKIGQAKSRCTYFAGHYPQFGVPEVLEFDLNTITPVVISMEQHVTKSIKSKRLAEYRLQVSNCMYDLKRARERLDKAESSFDKRQCQLDVDRAWSRLQNADTDLNRLVADAALKKA